MRIAVVRIRSVMETWSDREYADPVPYLRHRGGGDRVAGAAARAGRPALSTSPAATVGSPTSCPGSSTSASTPTRRWSRRRAEGPRRSSHADLNEFEPDRPVAATTIFRAIYYARDRRAFLRHVAGYTERKLVFDLNPRQYRLEDVARRPARGGWPESRMRPVLRPADASRSPARWAAALVAAERSGPLARLALRYRFTYLVAASK